MSVVPGHDAIHVNISHLPKGQVAGYTTGTPDIRWTDPDWHNHPGAVRICQDASASDHTADVLDVERGAATNNEAAAWYNAAVKSYNTAARPGQRAPAIYCSASNVTPLANALIAAGVKSGPKLWVASWGIGEREALAEVAAAGGPFPIIGVQDNNGQFFDYDVFSSSWLAGVSKPKPTVHSHTTSAGDTVASIASSRKMRPGSWLTLQEELGADVPALAAGALPAGITWRSKNP